MQAPNLCSSPPEALLQLNSRRRGGSASLKAAAAVFGRGFALTSSDRRVPAAPPEELGKHKDASRRRSSPTLPPPELPGAEQGGSALLRRKKFVVPEPIPCCSEVCAPGDRVGSAQVGFVPLCSVIFVPPGSIWRSSEPAGCLSPQRICRAGKSERRGLALRRSGAELQGQVKSLAPKPAVPGSNAAASQHIEGSESQKGSGWERL